ncbi:shikimate dehydrogenase [Panacibacter sp. DH6]|uniref:Shikimate dehydrogenase n=1 Tax=Panacibacter microcysteis TaxID=2793269 RepID=A0A931E4Q2_9BACT|nr:shikimate dehydrogenase [Panacibacter microcysteis]MBG9374948.1 shikimate dehydrogenase [Panacibacter microcysteis]
MTKEYGLIGYPLSHSFSQKYFTEKFHRDGITNAVFEAFAIPSIDYLPHLIEERQLLKGFAVTIPYKREVIQYLDYKTPAVETMNACNCVCIRHGKLHGYNTDITGFEKSFIRYLQPHHTKALILGTGGASSAVAFVLDKLHIDYRYVSRHRNEDLQILGYADLDENIMSLYPLIINCTPVGTAPGIDEAPEIPYQLLTEKHYLFDLVYNPAKTKFLALGEAQGAAIQNGYDMLILQAEENWKLWNQED